MYTQKRVRYVLVRENRLVNQLNKRLSVTSLEYIPLQLRPVEYYTAKVTLNGKITSKERQWRRLDTIAKPVQDLVRDFVLIRPG